MTSTPGMDRRPTRPRRRPTISRPASAIALSFALLVAGCHRPAAPTQSAPREAVKVSVVAPEWRELPRSVRATGTLFGDEEATIAAKVAGRVVEVARDLGDSAASGEVLARIDPTDYQLARDEREQAFREVLASIGLDALPEGTFALDALPNVERARLQAENAKARYERGKVLAERKPPLISDQDFADLKTTWDVAESNLRVERLNAEATLAEARTLEAQVLIAQQRVADAVHRAPTDATRSAPSGIALSADQGVGGARVYEIASRYISVGDFVQIGTPLFRLVDPNPLKLRAMIPERRLGTIKVGQTVSLQVEAQHDAFPGAISRVSPAVEVLTRNFMVEILVPNAKKELKPGSFGVAQILVGSERAMVVPERVVITFAGVHKVITVVDNKAVEKRVELGQRIDGMIEIVSGLTDKDVIVARPSSSLATGTPVMVSAEAPATAPPSAHVDPKK
jgi:HlyD family secretion protein